MNLADINESKSGRNNTAVVISGAALLTLPVAVWLHRSDLLAFHTALLIFAASALTCLVVFIQCLYHRFFCKFTASKLAYPLPAVIVSSIAILIIGTLFTVNIIGNGAPLIHDISTDTKDIPRFYRAQALRGANSNSLAMKPDFIALQRSYYPRIKTLYVSGSIDQVFERCIAIARELGWTVYNADHSRHIIEAYDKTLIWGFVDDIVIRLQPKHEKIAIDLRSVSRVGKGDLGANAKRIARFYGSYSNQYLYMQKTAQQDIALGNETI